MSKDSCNHYWNYPHAIWQAEENDLSQVAVGRYCTLCGVIQTAVAKDWGPLPESYVDMREVLTKFVEGRR